MYKLKLKLKLASGFDQFHHNCEFKNGSNFDEVSSVVRPQNEHHLRTWVRGRTRTLQSNSFRFNSFNLSKPN